MLAISRRGALASLAIAAGAELLPSVASATLVRGMTLEELVWRSRHAVIGTPLDARCVSLTIGGRRSLVTETRLRVDSVLALETPAETELIVRTLGGRLDGVGMLVHGQAQFYPGQSCLAFFERGPDGACWVTGMAQGHYPLLMTDGALVLQASPQLPAIVDWERSAVKRLVGKHLSEAAQLVAEAKAR
jgi:hypothetical protein